MDSENRYVQCRHCKQWQDIDKTKEKQLCCGKNEARDKRCGKELDESCTRARVVPEGGAIADPYPILPKLEDFGTTREVTYPELPKE